MLKAGDRVRHNPTGELWVLAAVESERVYPMGWPCCRAEASDCTLLDACSDEESLDTLRRVGQSEGADMRKSVALAQLFDRDLRAIGVDPAKRQGRPQVVVVCGSTRFIDQMAVAAWNLEKQGHIALSCHLLPASYGAHASHQAEAEGCAERLDYLHLAKVDMADRLLVVNVGGYIGASTRREIAYARLVGKPVEFLEPEGSGA